MRIAAVATLCCALAILPACGRAKRSTVTDLSGHEDLSFFKVATVGGVRDGDRLRAQALITDSASMLTLNLDFHIGSPTTLDSGQWKWLRNGRREEGAITARSVTFLGGQDGPPSIGGTFDLTGPDGSALYRVELPVSELKR